MTDFSRGIIWRRREDPSLTPEVKRLRMTPPTLMVASPFGHTQPVQIKIEPEDLQQIHIKEEKVEPEEMTLWVKSLTYNNLSYGKNVLLTLNGDGIFIFANSKEGQGQVQPLKVPFDLMKRCIVHQGRATIDFRIHFIARFLVVGILEDFGATSDSNPFVREILSMTLFSPLTLMQTRMIESILTKKIKFEVKEDLQVPPKPEPLEQPRVVFYAKTVTFKWQDYNKDLVLMLTKDGLTAIPILCSAEANAEAKLDPSKLFHIFVYFIKKCTFRGTFGQIDQIDFLVAPAASSTIEKGLGAPTTPNSKFGENLSFTLSKHLSFEDEARVKELWVGKGVAMASKLQNMAPLELDPPIQIPPQNYAKEVMPSKSQNMISNPIPPQNYAPTQPLNNADLIPVKTAIFQGLIYRDAETPINLSLLISAEGIQLYSTVDCTYTYSLVLVLPLNSISKAIFHGEDHIYDCLELYLRGGTPFDIVHQGLLKCGAINEEIADGKGANVFTLNTHFMGQIQVDLIADMLRSHFTTRMVNAKSVRQKANPKSNKTENPNMIPLGVRPPKPHAAQFLIPPTRTFPLPPWSPEVQALSRISYLSPLDQIPLPPQSPPQKRRKVKTIPTNDIFHATVPSLAYEALEMHQRTLIRLQCIYTLTIDSINVSLYLQNTERSLKGTGSIIFQFPLTCVERCIIFFKNALGNHIQIEMTMNGVEGERIKKIIQEQKGTSFNASNPDRTITFLFQTTPKNVKLIQGYLKEAIIDPEIQKHFV